MATAAHNIEGDARLSEKDGAGEIVADWADDVVQNINGTFHAGTYNSNEQSPADFPISGYYSIVAGRPTRIVLTWDVDHNYSSYSSQPSGDLDMQIIRPIGSDHRHLGQLRQQLRNRLLHAGDERHVQGTRHPLPLEHGRHAPVLLRRLPGRSVTAADAGAADRPGHRPRRRPSTTPVPTPTRTLTPKPPTKTPTPGPSPTPQAADPHDQRPTRGLPTPYM